MAEVAAFAFNPAGSCIALAWYARNATYSRRSSNRHSKRILIALIYRYKNNACDDLHGV